MTDTSMTEPTTEPTTGDTRRRQRLSIGATVLAVTVPAVVVLMLMGGAASEAVPYVVGAPIGLAVTRWWQGRGPKGMPDDLAVAGFTFTAGEIAHGDSVIRTVDVASSEGSTAAFVAVEAGLGLKSVSPGTWNGEPIRTDRGVGAKSVRVVRGAGGTVMQVRRVKAATFEAEVGAATITFEQPKRGARTVAIQQAVTGSTELADDLATLLVAYVASGQSRWLP